MPTWYAGGTIPSAPSSLLLNVRIKIPRTSECILCPVKLECRNLQKLSTGCLHSCIAISHLLHLCCQANSSPSHTPPASRSANTPTAVAQLSFPFLSRECASIYLLIAVFPWCIDDDLNIVGANQVDLFSPHCPGCVLLCCGVGSGVFHGRAMPALGTSRSV